MASGQRQTVNGVQTISLHGKNYVEVAERVHMVHEKKAVFSIVKSEPVNVADRWLWVAVIMVDGQQYIGNAEIKMNAPKNTPDGTNPFECGETSAIGRALAFAGFGSVESIASKDEIERSKPFTNSEQAGNSQDRQATNTASRPQQALAKPAEQAPLPATQPVSVQHASAERPYLGAFNAGREKGLWSDFLGFCKFATAELGEEVNRDNVRSLTSEQLARLDIAIKEEEPVKKAS